MVQFTDMDTLKSALLLIKDTVAAFLADRATIFAAGISYFSIFAIAPLLILIINIAGLFISRSAAGDLLSTQFSVIFGPELTEFIRELIRARADRSLSTTTTLISIAFLLVAAAGIFNQLKIALNLIWGVRFNQAKNIHEWLALVRRQAIPVLMVFLFGLLLSISVILDTLLTLVQTRFEALVPIISQILPSISRTFVPLLTFMTFLFIYKFLPDATTRWRDISLGALVASLLFLLGRYLLAVFLTISGTTTLYGAAGSIIVLLMWVYFSAAILLLGAEFIKLYAARHGQPIRPIRMSVLTGTVDS